LSAVETLSAGGVSEPPAISADPDGGFDPNVVDAVAAWSSAQQPNRHIEAAAQTAPAGADRTPPSFAGRKSATTCIPGIVYDIYQATKSGAEDFSAPTYTPPAGATSFTTPPLRANKSYYFVFRARDRAGNRDPNTVERVGQNLCV
jgi:hypothetical protein